MYKLLYIKLLNNYFSKSNKTICPVNQIEQMENEYCFILLHITQQHITTNIYYIIIHNIFLNYVIRNM